MEELFDDMSQDLLSSIIDTQMVVITTMMDIDQNVYDSLDEDKIIVVVQAMKIIQKAQKKIIKVLQ